MSDVVSQGDPQQFETLSASAYYVNMRYFSRGSNNSNRDETGWDLQFSQNSIESSHTKQKTTRLKY